MFSPGAAQHIVDDDTVQERRMHDVLRLQQNLEYLEDQLAEADADAAEACDREDTYSMMEQRLHSLVAQDQARINEIQRVIDESVMRLGQWHAVSKEGEAELTSAEASLAEVRTKIKTERHKQRKMMSERRTMVAGMVQYTENCTREPGTTGLDPSRTRKLKKKIEIYRCTQSM